MVTPHLPSKFHANRSSRFLVILLTKKQRYIQRKKERKKEIERKQYPAPGTYRGRGNNADRVGWSSPKALIGLAWRRARRTAAASVKPMPMLVNITLYASIKLFDKFIQHTRRRLQLKGITDKVLVDYRLLYPVVVAATTKWISIQRQFSQCWQRP